MLRRALHSYEALSSACGRFCKISYSSAAAAAATPSDSIRPSMRQRDQLVAGACATRGRRPLPSLPSTSTTPAPRVVGLVVGTHRRRSRALPAPAGRRLPRSTSSRPRGPRAGSRPGCARGRRAGARRRPAEALQTAGVTSAARRSGITTPAAPGALGGAADRAEVLRILDLVEGHQQRLGPREQLVGAGVGVGAGLGAHALVGAGAAAPLDLLGRVRCCTETPSQPRLARGAGGGPDLADARARRRPRSASRTGLRP